MEYKEFQTPLADNNFKESFDSVDYYVRNGMQAYVDGFKKEESCMKITELLSNHDSVELKSNYLIVDTGDTQISLGLLNCHYTNLRNSLINQLGDDEKRTLIKELEESLCK